ncbi:hypothetical protein P4K49_29340 [Bacillus cereus]|uniref:hypothetical protein n=1 Tax=Bacillus cereus group TaxID=86661 RepID=UPI000676F029|nr:hypothetical protein [Bacillus thuringiensis]AKR38745.1 Hypothetical protein NF53_p4097 [Bacillus thuringiensis serovar indiana]MEB8879870.1 hypothetical protein [Bacillus cereus]MEB9617877.1 hypothetical protein [Bacillus cereus]MEB9643854.1 hypothetical protein [Bacillus cereus]MEB9649663.1 hypothetical protein [Bacillus cereus]
MYFDYEIRLKVERERQRIITFLKEKGITQNSEGQRVDDLTLLSLSLTENKLPTNGK